MKCGCCATWRQRSCPFVPRLLEVHPGRAAKSSDHAVAARRVEHLDDERARELFAELEPYGVRHDDPEMRNVTYRQSDGRFCLDRLRVRHHPAAGRSSRRMNKLPDAGARPRHALVAARPTWARCARTTRTPFSGCSFDAPGGAPTSARWGSGRWRARFRLRRERRHGRRACGRIRQPHHGGKNHAPAAALLQAVGARPGDRALPTCWRSSSTRSIARSCSLGGSYEECRRHGGDAEPLLVHAGLDVLRRTSATAASTTCRARRARSGRSPTTTPTSAGFSATGRSTSARRATTPGATCSSRRSARGTSSSSRRSAPSPAAGRYLPPLHRRPGRGALRQPDRGATCGPVARPHRGMRAAKESGGCRGGKLGAG